MQFLEDNIKIIYIYTDINLLRYVTIMQSENIMFLKSN